MRKERKRNQMLQWHPAFYASIRIEFSEEADKLLFESEHQLGTKPKAIDVLIIRKNPKEKIHKNIGKIFRTHNIMEYKRPGDYLSIDDYYKVLGYACFYKSDTPKENTIPITDITISLVCHQRPLKLIDHLTTVRHLCLTEQEEGIFHVKGEIYPIQIICTSRLSSKNNLWLKGLTDNLKQGETVDRLLKEYRRHQNNVLYKSAMDMIIRANRKIFREEKSKMCEALRELFKDELEVGIAAGIEERLPKAVEEYLPKAVEKRIQEIQQKVRQEIRQEVRQEIQQEVRQEIRQEVINALIADYMEEGFSTEKILGKLEKRFSLAPEEARNCLERSAS